MYRLLRWAPLYLLLSHIALKAVLTDRSILLDLFLYNAIWICAVVAIAQSPLTNDPVALATASLAITFWGVGSILNSYSDFYSLPEGSKLLAQLSYTLFYPLALIAIPRSLARGRKLNPLELLDSAILDSESHPLQQRSSLTAYFRNLSSICKINSSHCSFQSVTYCS